MGEKWSQFAAANQPLTGPEIFAFGIEGDQSYQIDYSDLVANIFAYSDNIGSVPEVYLESTSQIVLVTTGGAVFDMDGAGEITLTDVNGASLNFGGGNVALQNSFGANFVAVANSFFISGTANFVATYNEGVAMYDAMSTGFTTDGAGNAAIGCPDNLDIEIGSLEINGNATFTGTLAAAITAGKSVVCGLVIN